MSCLEVVCGIIQNSKQQILVALRQKNKDQGGLWELPGGKRHDGEAENAALSRELKEELNITVEHAQYWMTARYQYPNYKVHLHAWHVHCYQGEAEGHEGQILRWVPVNQLLMLDWPAANYPIIRALMQLS